MADIYKRKRAKYSFEIYIGECTISLQGSILNHGLSLLRSSFLSGKAIYAIPLYVSGTRPKGGEKERSPSFPSPEDRNARTPSINCTFARPILDLSRRGSNPHDFPLYISIIFRTIDQSMYRFPSFLFRSRWKRGSSPLCILTSLRSVLPTVR